MAMLCSYAQLLAGEALSAEDEVYREVDSDEVSRLQPCNCDNLFVDSMSSAYFVFVFVRRRRTMNKKQQLLPRPLLLRLLRRRLLPPRYVGWMNGN
jgi:hypothetical protein